MAIRIADTATVDPRAVLADRVEIGPYCVVEAGVTLGEATRLIAHACLLGATRIGAGNLVGPFAVIGAGPAGDAERGGGVVVGDGNTIREGTSIERGGAPDGLTRIGDRNVIGPHVVIGRDATIGDEVVLGAGVRLGAFAAIESFAQLTPGIDVHPGVTVGMHGFAGGPSRIVRDVPRFLLVDGSPSRVRSINSIGLKRRGFESGSIRALREAHRLLFRAQLEPLEAARRLVDRGLMTPEVIRLLESLEAQRRGRHGRARDPSRRLAQLEPNGAL